MAFQYTPQLIESTLTYTDYQTGIDAQLAQPPKDEAAAKLRPYAERNAAIMRENDEISSVNSNLVETLKQAPATTWLLITEGWCGDAAFIVPVIAAIEKAVPNNVALKIALRDSNPDLIDANLTDGGRAIPILVILNNKLEPIGKWGPRPAELQTLVKQWKAEGLVLKELIPKVNDWYTNDNTKQIQQELTAVVKSYS